MVRSSRGAIADVVPDEHGLLLTPSVVAFTDRGVLVGTDAVRHASAQSDRLSDSSIRGVKRLLGRRHDDPLAAEFGRLMPFGLLPVATAGTSETARLGIAVNVSGQQVAFLPEEISAFVLAKMHRLVRDHIGDDEIRALVVTVPAQFSREQRVRRVGYEPTWPQPRTPEPSPQSARCWDEWNSNPLPPSIERRVTTRIESYPAARRPLRRRVRSPGCRWREFCPSHALPRLPT